jgi:hypothetical protein
MLCKTKDGSRLSKIDRSVDHSDIWWKGRDESRRCFGANVGCYFLLVFRRNASSSMVLLHVGGLMAFFGVRFVTRFLLSRPLPMAARRLRRLLIGVISFFITITLGPLLLLYLIITSLSIGGRRVTPSWPRAALRTLLAQCLLHGSQSGGIVPSLGPPLGGGFLDFTLDLHSHHLDKWKDMEMRDESIEEMHNTVIKSFQGEPRRLREKVRTFREVRRVRAFQARSFRVSHPKH